MRLLVSSLLLLSSLSPLNAQSSTDAHKFSPPSRKFRFSYNFTVRDLPAGTKQVRVWAPVPQSDQHQGVRILNTKAPAKVHMTREAEYGNRMMYVEIKDP